MDEQQIPTTPNSNDGREPTGPPSMDIKPAEQGSLPPENIISQPTAAETMPQPAPSIDPAASVEQPSVQPAVTQPPVVKSGGKKGKLIAIVIIGIVLVATAVYYYMQNGKKTTNTTAPTATTTTTTQTTPATASDVKQAITDVDSTISKANSAGDIATSDLSNSTLGL